ncbi:MAG TPA: RNA polymerase sigma factor [Verrucomicrobiae bacterium]|jgi:RNA polymerase sigma-70 factor (ECF subfamily)|nr:RNA polymerase sigma factor [Verrucomicrobiae bacterium]
MSSGDPFESVVREHQRMIYSLCYRMTGSQADAEDLAQETFLQAYSHWLQFRGDAKISSWLYRIAVNQCLNWNKRRTRREILHREWSSETWESSADLPPSHSRVQNALLQLHPKQRAAVVLTIYDGLSHKEAAKALGCSETTVSWRLFAARRKLKALLADLYPTKAS